jgi:hypothetical protein
MASIELTRHMRMVPAPMSAPYGFIWSSYDQAAGVLYIDFKKPAHATDGELTDDDKVEGVHDELCQAISETLH